MPKFRSVCLVAALTLSSALAAFFPVRKDAREPASSARTANLTPDRDYDSALTAIPESGGDLSHQQAFGYDDGVPIAIPESGGDTVEARDPVELSTRLDRDNTSSPAIGPGTLCDTLVASAQASGLPVVFFSNLIWQESRFHPDAVSRAGALGIAQFMPKTAAAVGLQNPLDPQQALPASARLLATLYREFGNWGLAAAAYNAGGKRVSDWLSKGSVLPKETRDYVLTITGRPVEQWSPANSESSTLVPAKKMPCRDVAGFTAAAANDGTTSHVRAAAEKPKFESPKFESSKLVDVSESTRLVTEREARFRRLADMRERWAGLRMNWAALYASGRSPAELPMDVGLSQGKKLSAKKPIRVAELSPEASHKGRPERLAKRRRS